MGKFITFEGGEGSGKTSHVSRLATWLRQGGYSVQTTHDPGGTEISIGIRPFLLDKKYNVSREAEFLLYLAARAELVNKVIIPDLEIFDFVLCDRFYDSTAVYQGVIRGWDEVESCDNCGNKNLLVEMHHKFCGNIQPDATFLFDVNPVLGLSRSLGDQKDESRWEEEGLAIHRKINTAFIELAEINDDRFIIIDANEGIDDVFYALMDLFKSEVIR